MVKKRSKRVFLYREDMEWLRKESEKTQKPMKKLINQLIKEKKCKKKERWEMGGFDLKI